eukprot:GHRQ01014606.1.p2 GENE.GHRQ01014606.1~~GHRQ01014606.1.p2  ORF type:complete len:106 (-),score=13.97 GHRQ01014606.1:3-320(-)
MQQQLQANTVSALRKAVPALTDADVQAMMRAPMRSYDPTILQVRHRQHDPATARLCCATIHCERWSNWYRSVLGDASIVQQHLEIASIAAVAAAAGARQHKSGLA